MSDAIRFDFRLLPGAPGWASCDLIIGRQTVSMEKITGAINDPLDDFLRATLLIATGSWEADFQMQGEPEPDWRGRLTQRTEFHPPRRELAVTIRRRRCDFEGPGDLGLWAVCSSDEFAKAIAAGARAAWDTFGPAEFGIRWSPFPMRTLVALEAALAIPGWEIMSDDIGYRH